MFEATRVYQQRLDRMPIPGVQRPDPNNPHSNGSNVSLSFTRRVIRGVKIDPVCSYPFGRALLPYERILQSNTSRLRLLLSIHP